MIVDFLSFRLECDAAPDNARLHWPVSTTAPGLGHHRGSSFPGAGVFDLAKARELHPVSFHLAGLAVCPSGLSGLQLPEHPVSPLSLFCKEKLLQSRAGGDFFTRSWL